MNHIAIIPARKNSVGLKHKNRLLFKYSALFVKKLNWFKKVIVSTDDRTIIHKAKKNKFITHLRSK